MANLRGALRIRVPLVQFLQFLAVLGKKLLNNNVVPPSGVGASLDPPLINQQIKRRINKRRVGANCETNTVEAVLEDNNM